MKKKERSNTKKQKKYYDCILILPCNDEDDEEENAVSVRMIVRFKSEEQQEELEMCGVYSDCLEEFNQALCDGKGEYEGKEKEKRELYVWDAGIEIYDVLKEGHGMEIDVDLSNKK